jgi:hypothetical protein
MTLTQALLVYGIRLMGNQPYDHQVMQETVEAIVATTSDPQFASTILKIIRWESGAFRRDVANCVVKGDNSSALGLGQIHPFNDEEKRKACSKDYREQISVILFHVQASIRTCSRKKYRDHWLMGEYVSGTCGKGGQASRTHWSDGVELTKLLHTEDNIILNKHNAEVMSCIEESDSLRLFAEERSSSEQKNEAQ